MNYYEQPVAQTFMDTYAPLPFQEIMALGAAYKKEKDETEAAIDEFKAKYGDFTSLSKRDVEAWDKETMGVLNPKLMEMAMDPEKIKSQDFQAGIRSAIRSVDTAKLGMLRQSAENLKKRADIIAQLMASGKYKESWDQIDIANWDTLGVGGAAQGIMTDLSPLEYKTLHDIAAPYSQALKDQYLGKIDRYRYWKGVDEAQIRNALNTASTDIFNTPQGQAWYRDISSELAMQGITDPEVVREEVMNRLVQSQKDYMHRNIEYDAAALKQDELALKQRVASLKANPKGDSDDVERVPARLTDMIRLDGKRYINDTISNLPYGITKQTSDELRKAQMDLTIANVKGNKDEIARATRAYENIETKTQQNDFATTAYNAYEFAIGRKLDKNTNVTPQEAYDGASAVVDLMSSNIPADAAVNIIEEYTIPRKENGETTYYLSNSKPLQSVIKIGSSVKGLESVKADDKFDKLLKAGVMKNLKIEPVSEKGLFNYVDKDGNFKQKQKVIVTVNGTDIDLTKVEDQASVAQFLQEHGAWRKVTPGTTTTTVVSGRNTSEAYDSPKQAQKGKFSKRTVNDTSRETTNIKNDGSTVYTFEAYLDIPDDISGVQGTSVSNINAKWNMRNLTPSQSGKIYPIEQEDAFYNEESDIESTIDLDSLLGL